MNELIKHKRDHLPALLKRRDMFRKELRSDFPSLEQISIPNNIKSVDELFSLADKKIGSTWGGWANKFLFKDVKNVMTELRKKNVDKKLIEILSNNRQLKKILKNKEFYKIEELKTLSPNIWQELLLFASEKEQLQLELLSSWVDKIPNYVFKSSDISREELRFALDLQSSIQPLIDLAYIREVREGEKNVSPEFKQIAEILNHFSQIISQSKNLKRLAGLSMHLKIITNAFNSEETDPEKLHQIWGAVNENTIDLVSSGCPLVMNIHNRYIDNNDDLEFSIQIRTKEAVSLEKLAETYRGLASSLSNKREIPPIISGYNLSNTAVNLYYHTIGEAGENFINIYLDRLKRKRGHLVFSNFLTTLLHEIGHMVGIYNIDSVFDEYKADLLGILIYKNGKKNNYKTISKSNYIKELIKGYKDEMVASNGEQGLSSDFYSSLGQFFVSFFIKNNIIYVENNKIKINTQEDVLEKFNDLASLGEEILALCNGDFNLEKANIFLRDRITSQIDNDALAPYMEIFEENGSA